MRRLGVKTDEMSHRQAYMRPKVSPPYLEPNDMGRDVHVGELPDNCPSQHTAQNATGGVPKIQYPARVPAHQSLHQVAEFSCRYHDSGVVRGHGPNHRPELTVSELHVTSTDLASHRTNRVRGEGSVG